MRDNKDHATFELPGFAPVQTEVPETKRSNASRPQRNARSKQTQLSLLEDFGPTDLSGLPIWNRDDNLDLTGLPVWKK